jgi:hypothetical protein
LDEVVPRYNADVPLKDWTLIEEEFDGSKAFFFRSGKDSID